VEAMFTDQKYLSRRRVGEKKKLSWYAAAERHNFLPEPKMYQYRLWLRTGKF
jgi:hypothetical protein